MSVISLKNKVHLAFEISIFRQPYILLIILISLLCGSLLTWSFMTFVFSQPLLTFSAIRTHDISKPLIRPLLAYNTPEMQTTSPLEEALKIIISTSIKNKQLTTASVYYRDLNTGRWFGINQDQKFVPASLFKVPLMIAYLKDVEKNPNLLSIKITDDLVSDENKNETIKALQSVKQGERYTIEQLLHYMIEFSDNNATVLLFKNVNQDTLRKVFSDLDIQIPTIGVNTDFISVGNYSFLFRVLYNATYLSHEMSEKGLEMLSKIDFENGIRSGDIPKSITIADKFGEYYSVGNDVVNEHQLHDCGIIYHPKHPYLLCVMTKGEKLEDLKKLIQEVSKVTYGYVSAIK